MKAKIVKKYLYTLSMLVLCFSCTKEKRNEIIKKEIFELQAGDLVCRNGNVDFYLSNGKIISWCRVHNTYLLSKNFDVKENGIYSDYQEDKGKIYTTVIRFKGGKDEK